MSIINKSTNKYDEILNLGLKKVSQRKIDESKECFFKLIQIDKSRYEAYLNISNLLIIEKRANEANKILEDYLKNINKHNEIVNGLAIHLFNSNNFEDLFKHVNLYIEDFNNYLLNYLKGFCLYSFKNANESEFFLKKSIELNKSFWKPYELLFDIYDRKSKFSEMEKLIKLSKNIFIDSSQLKYFEALYFFRISEYEKAQSILQDKNLNNFYQKKEYSTYLANYYNLLSKNYEKLLDYENCFSYAIKRNKTLISLDKNKNFNKKNLNDTVDSYIKFFDVKTKFKFKSNSVGLDHSNLTFLIGFPRSGTTLLDTILRSHSKTFVIEEQPYLLNLRHSFFKKNQISNLLDLSEVDKIKIQDKYFNSFNYNPNKITIDKFPLNLLELGFIKTIFPNSKIILAMRHPLDCLLSCVLTSFKINEAMLNFENLQTSVKFYNKTFSLLIKYIEFFDINFFQIKYEDVVNDFDNNIRQLLQFLEIEFESSINKFYETAKKRNMIETPSFDQVVKPLYSSSINKHLNFNEINIIKNDVLKWIEYFSYK